MTDSNSGTNELGLFSELVAAILQALASKGLKRRELCSTEFYKQVPHAAKDLSEFDDTFCDSLTWLRDEGFIKFGELYSGTENESCAELASLTGKCISTLNQPLATMDGKTMREILQANADGDSAAAVYIKTGAFLGDLAEP